ncbi:hypothetical protein RHOER0001_2489 [Rhodococcus erythropolis SK121]|nr:hypothetical protein RHOER0001_2489 [Rhodococcus erythropolis SK121]
MTCEFGSHDILLHKWGRPLAAIQREGPVRSSVVAGEL